MGGDISDLRNREVSGAINDFAAEWDKAAQAVPEKATSLASDIIRDSGKYFVPAAMVGGGSWVATEHLKDALRMIQGKDGSFFKASTSRTDQVLGTAVHGLMTAAGVFLIGKGALKIASNIAEAVEKKG